MEPGTQPQGYYTPAPPQYAGGQYGQPAAPVGQPDAIEWDASEYIHHDKGFGWAIIVGVIGLSITGLALWFGQWVLAVLLVVMTVVFVMFGFRRPRTLHYRLTETDITISGKSYSLGDFRAFGVVPDGGVYSVMFIPLKRFAPAITIYFAENDGEQIVDILGAHLPMEEIHQDYVDLIMRKLRF